MSADRADEDTPLIAVTTSPRQPTAMPDSETFWKVGAIYGATAVMLGAFGAHGLKKHISDPAKIANWSTAAHYQLVHAVALLVARDHPVAAGCFTAGMTLFSGSIYALTLNAEKFRFLGPVTPLGGLFLMAGWAALAFGKAPGAPRRGF
ncbi:hypothetical protein QBC34DRAFT_409945 [Podospora aff. communis PSN243]|uniref:Uncharacterized protein n=1 Tax=Podospora aff. communis PSN243 TaxID=3040156 RepID=A0AAV9GGT3_9PEZI|nr:hypothetical protein QBC34DRAFT_409945 [Podospora aff. communis PSN243]